MLDFQQLFQTTVISLMAHYRGGWAGGGGWVGGVEGEDGKPKVG